ncbi:hypothetical protein ACOMHN_064059 [Nucella lapillus]
MNAWTVVLMCVATVTSTVAQQTPCSPKDPGPFLATPPSLSMEVYETTAQELTREPQKYRAEVRLHGESGGQGSDGIMLEVMPDYTFMNPEDSFRFTSTGGVNYVQMYKPVDRDGPTPALDDDTNVFSFTLKCSKKANMSDIVYYTTKIFVFDINDNAPEFVNLTSTLTLNELTPPGLSVLTVKAQDKDFKPNLTYNIVPRTDLADDMSGHFTLDRSSGQLSVSRPLDYETMAQGTLVLAVEDGGSPVKTATGTVQVRVEDGDDQGPVYVYSGCWMHRGRCAWPKFTTSTSITQGQPISVLPVPNKVKSNVMIKAKDLDHSANPISFSIASTIPPGQEGMFSVTTAKTGGGEYAATITPLSTTVLKHGFEIFLRADEQSSQGRFEVAMIFFEDSNNMCASGSAAAQNQNGDKTSSNDDGDEKYSDPVLALIVVVAILAAFVLCLAIAFFCMLRRSPASRGDDVTLNATNRNGHAAF